MPHRSAQRPTLATVEITLPADEMMQAVLHYGLRALTISLTHTSGSGTHLTSFENDVFVLRTTNDLEAAYDGALDTGVDLTPQQSANFHHKPSGLLVTLNHYWDEDFTVENDVGVHIPNMIQECLASLNPANSRAAA
jgi:hypothetical protein